MVILKSLVFLITAAMASISLAAGSEMLFQDDFESPTTQSPPSNWAMWGANKYKTPAHYTRDVTRPHGGQACFRIFHPAWRRIGDR